MENKLRNRMLQERVRDGFEGFSWKEAEIGCDREVE